MNEIITKTIPIFLIFLLGYVLKKNGILKKEDGDIFLKTVFYVAAPSLIILSVSNIDLRFNFIFLPIIAGLIILCTAAVAYLIGSRLNLPRKTLGVFLMGSMIMNTSFLLPFIIATYGKEGLAIFSIFDSGNAFVVFTFIYYVACKYGDNDRDQFVMMKKFIFSPLLWALVVAVIINFSNFTIPGIAVDLFQLLGNLVTPLVMLSLGVYFSLSTTKLMPVIVAIVVRMIFGFFLGFVFVSLFKLEGLSRMTVLIASAAPAGYNTLTFSSLENLDKEFAANLISISILLGFVTTSVVIIFFLR